MSKKMKGVAFDLSGYGSYADAKARFKHQSLIQDYQDLEKETVAAKNKLEFMKQRKLTLLAEVRFLRRRHKYLLERKAAEPSQGKQICQPLLFHDKHKTTTKKEKENRKKGTKLQDIAPILGVNLMGMTSTAKTSACKAKEFPLNRKEKKTSGRDTSFKKKALGLDLNQEGEYVQKDVTFKHPSQVLHWNRKEEANCTTKDSGFDLNLVEKPSAVGGDDVQNRVPVFDLNLISGEDSQDNYETVRTEEPKRLFRDGSEDQLNDMKLSLCRNVENVPNRSGKRKISWQDPVALKV